VFTLYLPGIESFPPEAGSRLQALETLVARSRRRPAPRSPWDRLAEAAGGSLQRWPVAPVSALAELPAPLHTALRVEPLGMMEAEQGAFRLPARTLAVTREEAEALAAAFNSTFGGDGLQLFVARPERWYLDTGAETAQAAWAGFAAPAGMLDAEKPVLASERPLRQLLSEAEMLFHAHPVNVARRDSGRPQLIGLHAWGGGALHLPERVASARPARVADEEPYLAGLRRLGVVPPQDSGRIGAGGIAWPVAPESFDHASLAGCEREWGRPLLDRLLRGRLVGVRIVTAQASYETTRLDALKFWRRPRPLGEFG
jgi:hypothetical protein